MIVNAYNKTIGFKIVYYGAAFSGKTTNVRKIAEKANVIAGDSLFLDTRGSRTIFFDLVTLRFGKIGDYDTYFNIYTTPGQNVYVSLRRTVLNRADAVVFVMDSQQSRLRDNVQAWYTMERQLLEWQMSKHKLPIVIQLNKRDMPFVAPVDQLLRTIKAENYPHFEAVAHNSEGVFETLRWVVDHVVDNAMSAFKEAHP